MVVEILVWTISSRERLWGEEFVVVVVPAQEDKILSLSTSFRSDDERGLRSRPRVSHGQSRLRFSTGAVAGRCESYPALREF